MPAAVFMFWFLFIYSQCGLGNFPHRIRGWWTANENADVVQFLCLHISSRVWEVWGRWRWAELWQISPNCKLPTAQRRWRVCEQVKLLQVGLLHLFDPVLTPAPLFWGLAALRLWTEPLETLIKASVDSWCEVCSWIALQAPLKVLFFFYILFHWFFCSVLFVIILSSKMKPDSVFSFFFFFLALDSKWNR